MPTAALTVPDTDQNLGDWSYEEAFKRNRGLISEQEQEKLRNSRVAIAGMGGVGGVHLVTLARLGVGKFTIADPDVFEVANFNRQYGATISNLGRNKAEVMAEVVLDINPDVEITVIDHDVDRDNVERFLEGVDLVVDGIDAFEIDARRMVHYEAARRNIWALGAGPVGFSTVWVIFDPRGLKFDRYFRLSDELSDLQKFVSYVVGMAPLATQKSYMELRWLKPNSRVAPSSSLACQLATGVVGAESLKILLKRPGIRPAPYYHQFDPYVLRFVRRRLLFGNGHPMQRLKIQWLLNKLQRTYQANPMNFRDTISRRK